MRKILVPSDFSQQAQEAYKFATDIACRSGGEVFVLHVIELPFFTEMPHYSEGAYQFDRKQFLHDLKREAEDKYQTMKQDCPETTASVSFFAEQGPLIPTVRQFIAEKDIDLVVMGTQGATGWKEYFIGSNTEKIVRTSPVPVFSVREAPVLSFIRHIVLPTDLDLGQEEWMNKVKVLQRFFHATLHVLLVNTRGNMPAGTEERLEEYARYYRLSNYTLNIRNNFLEQDGILSFAYETNAGMIAMATHGRRGLSYLVSGSIAEKVVNRVTCPIWTCVTGKRAGKRLSTQKIERV